MIRTHFYNTQRECLIGLTEQLFKHFSTTRFVESNVVRHYKLRRKYEPEQNDNSQKQLHFPPPLLALPGGETGKQLAKLWSEEYAHCDLWHKLHYYWTEEECVPSDNADSCFGSMRDQFSVNSTSTCGTSIPYTEVPTPTKRHRDMHAHCAAHEVSTTTRLSIPMR